MRAVLAAFCASVATLTFATSANAATFVLDLTGPTDSAYFGNSSSSSGSIFDTFTFDVPAGVASGFVGSIALGSALDVTLTSVKFNGTLIDKMATGAQELWVLPETGFASGKQTLEIKGTWGSGGGSYAGTVNYAANAVPEPASWAMLIAGFGAVGATMRRGRRQTTVRYA